MDAATAPSWPIDSQASPSLPVYTRMNASDVMPDPVTPLGASLAWWPAILPGWAAGYAATKAFELQELWHGGEPAPGGFFYGHLYVNLSAIRLIAIRQGIDWAVMDAALVGVNPDTPPHRSAPTDHNPALEIKIAEHNNWILTATEFPELEEDRAWADRCRRERPDLSSASDAVLVARARSMMPLERLVWRGENVAGSGAAVGPAVLNGLLGGDQALVVRLVGRAGDVDSAAPTYALWQLSRIVRGDGALTAAFDGPPDERDARALEHESFAAAFQRFIDEYGYRGPSEWDLGSASWETAPQLVFGLIDRLRTQEDDDGPSSRQAEQAENTRIAFEEALTRLPDDEGVRRQFQAALDSSRRFGSWRERGKANCIKVLHEARVALAELGRRLHGAGHLASPGQIFMALDSELDLLIAQPASLTELLARREREWRALFGLEVPVFVEGDKPLAPLSGLKHRHDSQVAVASAGEILQGVGASAGVARGPARVVLSMDRIQDFEPGEILVAPQTDPSWTPLFTLAAAVVVDVGSMSSHAMIVSRELGIPCAAGVTGASRRITTGSLVEVDGSSGTVTLLPG